MEITNVLKQAIISEKSLQAASEGFYTFKVDRRATKSQIKKAVEDQFNVEVVVVRTLRSKGKKRRVGRKRIEIKIPGLKKALVKLEKGQKIDIFEVQESQKKG